MDITSVESTELVPKDNLNTDHDEVVVLESIFGLIIPKEGQSDMSRETFRPEWMRQGYSNQLSWQGRDFLSE